MSIEVLVGGKRREEVLAHWKAQLQSVHQNDEKPITTPSTFAPGTWMRYLGLEWTNFLSPQSTYLLGACEWIKKENFDRPPYPRELFSLLMDYNEGLLPGAPDFMIKEVLSRGVWLDCHVLIKDDMITFYEHYRKNPIQNPTPHITTTYTTARLFPREGFSMETPDPLRNHCHSPIIEYLWSRPFHQLPELVRETATIELPPPGKLLPLHQTITKTGLNLSTATRTHYHGLGVRTIPPTEEPR